MADLPDGDDDPHCHNPSFAAIPISPPLSHPSPPPPVSPLPPASAIPAPTSSVISSPFPHIHPLPAPELASSSPPPAPLPVPSLELSTFVRFDCLPPPDSQTSETRRTSPPPPAAGILRHESETYPLGIITVPGPATSYRQGNWSLAEILVLLEGKAKQEAAARGAAVPGRRRNSAEDKWRIVSDHCRSCGVNRSKEQCKVKWDNMMPEFRKVRDYEHRRTETAGQSYFFMEPAERRAKMLPSNMDMTVYRTISAILCNRQKQGATLHDSKNKLPELFPSASPSSPLLTSGGVVIDAPISKRKRLAAADDSTDMETTKIHSPVPSIRRCSSSAGGGDDEGGGGDHGDSFVAVPSRSRRGLPPPSTSVHPCFDADKGTNVPSLTYHTTFSPPPLTSSSHSGHRHGLRAETDIAIFQSDCTRQKAEGCGGDGTMAIEAGAIAVDAGGVFMGVEASNGGGESMSSEAARNRLIEDRKDARHREMMALEREKLVVLQEASYAMANAMNSAVSLLSKVAEELFRCRRRRRR